MWKVVTSSNLNPPLKLFFYSPILINNNILLKIYCDNIFQLGFLFYFLYYFFHFHPRSLSFFLFSFSCFSPPHKCPAPFFLFSFSSHQEHSNLFASHQREERERRDRLVVLQLLQPLLQRRSSISTVVRSNRLVLSFLFLFFHICLF